jgi:membrane protein Man1
MNIYCNLFALNFVLFSLVLLIYFIKSIFIFPVGLSVIGLYFIICYITAKGEKYKLEVTQLVENTIDLLKERALNQPDESYLPIIHVRDHLIPFNERQGMCRI